ncbi:Bud13 [Dillenia turbinata]|uniref:Bud13 n=1 Tax=Dillenia turbinata TaxID=194707 RepID=A0AAN8VA12_9MAGN
MSGSASVSLKEYLKKYQDGGEEEKKKKKRKKKTKSGMMGVLVVDEDPVWQKPVVEEEEQDNDSADEEKPQVDEDIEVKRLKRLEQLKSRPYHAISEDGSGWVAISDAPSNSNLNTQNSDMSPPCRRTRNDSPSPEHDAKPREHGKDDSDLSPPKPQRRRHHSPSPEPESKRGEADDLSPPRQQRRRYDSPSPEPESKHRRADDDLSPPRPPRRRHHSPSPEPESKHGEDDDDLLPSRQQRRPNDSPSPESESKCRRAGDDLSLPRQRRRSHHALSLDPNLNYGKADNDLSPPRPQRRHYHSPSPRPAPATDISPLRRPRSEISDNKGRKIKKYDAPDISPPRRSRRSPVGDNSHTSSQADLSPPRKSKKHLGRPRSPSLSSQKNHRTGADSSRLSTDRSLSPPRANRKEPNLLKERPKTGLVTAKDIKEEIAKTRKDNWLRFKDMDPSSSGWGAEPVYRDKITGDQISKEEYLKSQKKEEKPKEIKLEWGKGLAQKREAEARQLELEAEKEKPFARTRDDPELDKMLKNRLRWGDPMAHLVKRKLPEPVLTDFGENEKMKESGFVIPQDIPNHSWLKRGLDAAPNRYGIRPGRHWDGVDRSNGYEKQLFKRMNEKQATEREAYLWSVSDM